VDIEVRGDSKAALSWASTHCFKSPKATNTSMMFILTCIAFGFTVRESVHIPGKKNWRADDLSRKVIGSTAVEDVIREIGSHREQSVRPYPARMLQPLKIYE
jgi:transcription elongation factor